MPGYLDQAVTIRIGFEDWHDRSRCDVIADGLIIAGESGQIYFDLGWSQNSIGTESWSI